MVSYQTKAFETAYGPVSIVELEIEGGVMASNDLPAAVMAAPDVPMGHGVVISGRAPIWLMAALCHEYHPLRWVATFDPRLGGGVVVARHHPEAPSLGEVIPVE